MLGINKYIIMLYTILFLYLINFVYETLIIVGILFLILKLKEIIGPIVTSFLNEYIVNSATIFVNTLNIKLVAFLVESKYLVRLHKSKTNDLYLIKHKSNVNSLLFKKAIKTHIATKIKGFSTKTIKTL